VGGKNLFYYLICNCHVFLGPAAKKQRASPMAKQPAGIKKGKCTAVAFISHLPLALVASMWCEQSKAFLIVSGEDMS